MSSLLETNKQLFQGGRKFFFHSWSKSLVVIIMTELLGNQFCVDSLRTDVQDIHSVMNNVTSRLGQINYTSWKFPDKLALDVNIPELLEMCEYDGEYEEENKISHLLLLEMVVDR